jgi:hypothetical protein
MNFTSPAFLWLFAALAPLVAIYFLKIRPRRLPVTAFFLWGQVFQERRASSLFQRLRDLLSLLLLALVVSALALAAAGPRRGDEDRRDLLIVIDTTPSMRAGKPGADSLHAAKSRARDMIRALNGTRRAALATASAELDFLCHFSAAPKDLLDALARVEAGDVPASPAALQALAGLAPASSNASHRLVFLTDGNPGWQDLPGGVEVMRVGRSQPNAGITAADLAWTGSGQGRASFHYRIEGNFPAETHGELELNHLDGGGLARLIPIVLRPGQPSSATLDVEDARPGRWLASLRLESDSLAADNEVPLGLAPPRILGVRLHTGGDGFFFDRCIDAFARTGGSLRRVASGPADLHLSRGTIPPGQEPVLCFAPTGDSPFWDSIGPAVEFSTATTTIPDHPLLRLLDLPALRLDGVRSATPGPDALILAQSESGVPLLWKKTVAGRHALIANFDPSQGDFFLSPWFPVLVHAAMTELGGTPPALAAAWPTGSRITDAPIESESAGPLPSPAILRQRGHYHWIHENRREPFGAAILDAAESILDGSGPAENAREISRGHPLAHSLLLLAIALLVAESILYHRRLAG